MSRVIIAHYGIAAFTSFSLMIALVSLLPFQDLGVGAAVTTAYAENGSSDARTFRTLLTATRVLLLSTLGVSVGAVIIGLFGLWPTLLGASSGPNRLVAAGIVTWALSFVFGLGARILLGLDRNHVTVLVQTAFAPVALLVTFLLIVVGTGTGMVVLIPPLGILIVAVVTMIAAARISSLSMCDVLGKAVRVRRFPGMSIRDTARPMFIISICVPIAVQCDRVVLSHVGTRADVAAYTIAVQIFTPVAALVATAATPLWPMWVRARRSGNLADGLGKIITLFTGATALASIVLIAVADPLGSVIGDSRVHLGFWLPLSAGLMVTSNAAAYPIAMALTDPKALRFVGLMNLVAMPTNVALSIWFALLVGAPGPLLATALVGVVILVVPGFVYAHKRRRAGSASGWPELAAPSVSAV